MNSQYAMRAAKTRAVPRYKKVDRAAPGPSGKGAAKGTGKGAAPKGPPNGAAPKGPPNGAAFKGAKPIARTMTRKMNQYADRVVRHANAVREGSASLSRTDAAYLLGVMDADLGILRSKGTFTAMEVARLRDHVVTSVLANPSLVLEGPGRVNLRAHEKPAYRDF